MARAVWKGQLSFGLVSIPVELHTAVRDTRPRFRLLHAKDLSPISMERVCQHDGKPVAWSDLVKGFEVEPGRFVAITEDDFRTAAVERSQSIAILDFVKADDIDDRYFDVPYLLAPAKGGDHTYVLLRDALEKTGRAGIAKYVMRTRQHLAAVQVVRGHLVLTTMRFQKELIDPATVVGDLPRRGGSKRELDLAIQLVEGLASTWDPSAYKDDYSEQLLEVIDEKARSGRVARPARARETSPKVVNLMDRLRESLAQTEAAKNAKKKTTKKKPGARAKKKAQRRSA